MHQDFEMVCLVLFVVLGPLFFFLYSTLKLQNQVADGETAIDTAALKSWKNPPDITAQLPVPEVVQTLSEMLPQFLAFNGSWHILNIDHAETVTISANLPCIDDHDPNYTERLDLGLIVKIYCSAGSAEQSFVMMQFIVYEGSDDAACQICMDTAAYVDRVLKEKVMDFRNVSDFLQNHQVADEAQIVSAPQVNAAQEPVTVPEPVMMPEPISMPEPTSMPEAAVLPASVVSPEPLVFPQPVANPDPVVLPAAFTVPEPMPVSVTPPLTAETKSDAALCPGCSQPINPSFPFCLYCGKNF